MHMNNYCLCGTEVLIVFLKCLSKIVIKNIEYKVFGSYFLSIFEPCCFALRCLKKDSNTLLFLFTILCKSPPQSYPKHFVEIKQFHRVMKSYGLKICL